MKTAKLTLLAFMIGGLSACGMTKISDFPEYLDSPFKEQGPKEFITEADLQKIQLGMSPLEVTNRLGPPMLNDANELDRWDYVLRQGAGADETYVSYGVYFNDKKVVKVAPLEQPPESIVGNGMPEPVVEAEAVSVETVELAPEPAADDASMINDMLNGWVTAWAGQDVSGYISFYADTFQHGMRSRSAWESQRTKRLSSPSYISVSLSNVEIDLQSESLAEVSFTQDYSSSSYTDSGSKVLVLSKASGEWKIQEEKFKK